MKKMKSLLFILPLIAVCFAFTAKVDIEKSEIIGSWEVVKATNDIVTSNSELNKILNSTQYVTGTLEFGEMNQLTNINKSGVKLSSTYTLYNDKIRFADNSEGTIEIAGDKLTIIVDVKNSIKNSVGTILKESKITVEPATVKVTKGVITIVCKKK